MPIPVLSELKGYPKENIPSTTINIGGNTYTPPKIITVRRDFDRMMLTGVELNTGDYVKVVETGKIWQFIEKIKSQCCDCNEWVLYDGPVDDCGYPVTDSGNGSCTCPPSGTPGTTTELKKEAYNVSFTNETEKIINHTLNTSDMVVSVYDSSKRQVLIDVQLVGATIVKLNSQAPITETFRVVLIG